MSNIDLIEISLVIDDNTNLVNMIEEYFKGHSLISVNLKAYSGDEGINIIESKQSEYDVIILDLIMPNKDGVYVLDEMKKDAHQIMASNDFLFYFLKVCFFI